jgi:c-di-GMP-related signal transduction protein
MDYNKPIFKNKSIADIMSEVYEDKQTKQKQLKGLISMLKDLIQDGGDAIMMIPQIKELMDLDIKNNDTLLRLMAIIQKIEAANLRVMSESNGGLMTDEEKQLLLESLEELGIGE